MAKRRVVKKKSNKNSVISYIFWSVGALVVLAAIFGAGYFLGFEEAQSSAQKSIQQERMKQERLLKQLKTVTTLPTHEKTQQKKLQHVLAENQQKYQNTAQHEYATVNGATKPPKPYKRVVKKSTSRPKLAIIIDDVSFARDVREIKGLKIPLTMSFLPPNRIHPNSAKLAAKEPYYMVHLPMEAMNFPSAEPLTLKVNNSQQEILAEVQKVKKLFPRVQYINNHTGSKFTSNERAMNRLMFALQREKIGFIDSRTTAKTKVPLVMKNYGLNYISRDVFLDHDSNVAAIKKQIARAVKIAKTHGSAIAIGHPHKETIQALAESKQLLREVQLVRIDSLI